MHDAVIVNRGFQALNTVHFNHNIKCVAQRAAEAIAVHYTIGSSHMTSVFPFQPHEAHSKYSISGDISQLIYIRKYRLYVAFCLDLTLRVFSEHFDPIQTVHVTATVLSFAFNESTSELYCGGVGCFEVWQLQHQLHSPLTPGKAISCSVGQQQWVISLYHDLCAEKLVVACQDIVFIIDAQSRKQSDVFSNLHKSSITSAILYPQMDYLLSAAKDGSIKVWNCILHTEVHTFSGHLKAITGLRLHPLSPCVISCSLDGTVRMWSLENLTESYRLDCGEELLGLSCDFPTGVRMACFSHQNVKMWTVNKVESHFATVNSHVASMIRMESAAGGGCPARILALAEDGGVRLLSPVTGQVVSILFPMFSSQIIHEVAYSLTEGRLFSLLRTGEVLVFSSLSNPCSASQLWTSATDRDRITCIALCTAVDQESSVQSLVFGGQECGHISLLHASGLSMPHPCPAHAGHVIKLTSPTDRIDLTSSNPALVSYGSDNMLSIWGLEVTKRTQNVVLKIRASISLKLCPTHMGLLHSTLCLALSDNKIVQLDFPPDSRYECLSLDTLPLLTHQPEDDHTEEITPLSSCTRLKLFATSSSDGYVKVWGTDNHLVSEIHFGASLASVGFANPLGDLLVGFQKHICIVEAGNYLPAELVTEHPHCDHDSVEEPITFDPELEFWYDPARVPSLPVQQEKRKLLPTPNCDPSCGVLLEEERDVPVGSGATSVDSAASKRSLQFCHTQMVDRPLARKLSSQYFTSLDPEHRKRSSTLKLPPQEPLNVTEDCSDQASSQQLQHNFDSCKHSILPSIAESPGDSQSGTSSNNSFVLDSQNKTPPAAEILPLESASSKFPIAPDCLIPNSIIRAQIGYIPPEFIIPTRRPKLKMKQPPSAVQENSHALAKPLKRLSGEEQTRRSSTWAVGGGEVITCISEFLEPDPPVKKERTAQSLNRQTSLSGAIPGRTSSHRTKPTGMDNATSIERLSTHSHGPSSARRDGVGVTGARPKVVTRFEPPLEEQVQSRKASRQSHEGRGMFSSDASKPIGPSPRRHSSTREFQLPGRLSRNHSTCGESPVVVQRSHSNSCSTSVSASSGQGHKNIVSALPEKRLELSDVEKLLQQVTSQPWYPSHRKGSAGSTPAVVDTLVSMLKSAQMPVFHKVGSVLLELEEASLGLLTDDQRQSAVHHILTRLSSKAKSLSMKTAILKLLEGLGMGGREVILAILPLLTNSDLELRSAAFGTLKRLAGIVNRAQLHQLLIQLGLLQNVIANEDEILRDLSSRIKAGQVKVPAVWYTQESRFRDMFKHLNERETGISTAPRGSHIPKHAVDMENDFLTHVEPEERDCPGVHTPSMDTTVQQLHVPTEHQSLATYTATLPKVHMQVRKRATPGVDACAQPQSNERARDYCSSGDRLQLSVLQRYSNPHRPNGPATMLKSNLSTCSKLHQLIAHNPTAFSQTEPVIGMMLGAYTESKRATNTEDYTWSEVFPVIKAARKLGTHQRSKSLPNKFSLPRLDTLTTAACLRGGAGRSELQVQDTVVVKLPKITVSRVTYT